jgi:DNA primase small subunit
LPPSLERLIVELLEPFFVDTILPLQEPLQSKEQWDKILELVGDEEIAERLNEEWGSRERSSSQRWEQLKLTVEDEIKVCERTKNFKRKNQLDTAIHVVVCTYTYPRLDANVTKTLNHLLKSPFAVHPKTGNVCVPIDFDKLDTFDPFNRSHVPTVGQLIDEINAYDSGNGDAMVTSEGEGAGADGEKLSDVSKTTMKAHIRIFEKFIQGLEGDIKKKRNREQAIANPAADW